MGAIMMDNGGILYVCTNSGTPGTWARVGEVRPSFGGQANTGGVMNLLPNPIRLLDTRNSPGTPYAGGTTHTLQVTGASDLNGSSTIVPAGAVGVIGNVTAVSPQGGGNLTLFPSGTVRPGTSNLNYNANVTINTSITVGLNGSGAVDIFVNVGTTHVVFDASGFVI